MTRPAPPKANKTMSGPLSKLQKRQIAIAATRAYEAWPEREAFEAINSDLSKTARFEAWRHVEQGKACGVQHMRQMAQEHFAAVLAHFQAIGGHDQAATRTRARGADNGRRIALYKVRQELAAKGLSEGYAAAICQAKYKCPLADASREQLWKIFFDLKNRRKAERQMRDPDPF